MVKFETNDCVDYFDRIVDNAELCHCTLIFSDDISRDRCFDIGDRLIHTGNSSILLEVDMNRLLDWDHVGEVAEMAYKRFDYLANFGRFDVNLVGDLETKYVTVNLNHVEVFMTRFLMVFDLAMDFNLRSVQAFGSKGFEYGALIGADALGLKASVRTRKEFMSPECFDSNIRRPYLESSVVLYKHLLKGGSFVFRDFTDSCKIRELARFLESRAYLIGGNMEHKAKVRKTYCEILDSMSAVSKSNKIKR